METALEQRAMRTILCAFACVLAALLAAGCSTVTPREDVSAAPEVSDTRTEPTSDEVMYRVFAGEYLGSEGDLDGAVKEYLQAAMESDDPAIARRATRIAFAAESWMQASMAADRWALLDPENVAAHESAATAMLRVGDFAGAEFQIMKILDLSQDSTDGWLMVSNLLASSGNPAQADEVLEQILQRRGDADRAEVYYARSQLAMQSRKMQQAFELARRAVEEDPKRVEFLTWAGRLALGLKLPETGLEYIRRAWKIDPGDHDLALAYADLLARTGQPDEARKVMVGMKQTPDVMLSRILFEIAAGDDEAASRLFDRFGSMRFDDKQEKAFYQAQAAEALGRNDRAIELYGEVHSGERQLAAAIRRAELTAAEGDVKEARRQLAELREQPNDLAVEESWLAEARILREDNRREDAMTVLDDALEQMPKSVSLLYTRALLAAELGWIDIAERDLREVLSQQPENAAALNALGYTLADQTERYDEAEALIRQAYILQPNEPSIVDSMGWIAYRQGRNDEAIQHLRRAWALDRNPEIAAHLGEVLWVTGRTDEARSVWRDAMQIDSQSQVLQETIDRLGADL
ncbi:MAG: tetratricopeptide repeat protein [Lysobacterales bacterium]|jgi:tetratricopeptide (TPR) repeat protein